MNEALPALILIGSFVGLVVIMVAIVVMND